MHANVLEQKKKGKAGNFFFKFHNLQLFKGKC